MTQAAEFWNDGWIFNPGELPDMEQVPSNGKFKLIDDGWNDTSLTLEANDQYWGTPAGTSNWVYRFVEDAGMAQALQNGDVQVIEPQATVDTVALLEAIGESVTVEGNQQLTWEHLDFNFRDNNVFSDAQGGVALREAFALCVPRQGIVDSLIAPINPDATIMNAREVFPFQENYESVVGESYDGRFDEVDIAGAQAKVEESGIATPIQVRMGYRAPNQRRSETVAAIAASCREAGFEVTDSGSDSFFENDLVNGDYEVALFAWAGSGQIASGQNIYATGLPQNFGEYSNADVDAAWDTLASSLDPEVHAEQTVVIEKLLWDTLYGIPLYAHPGVVAYDSALENIRPSSAQDGVSWNASQWKIS
ncbi:MAG: ABC transporter substrate-binding protein [Arachnia sp.]